jgi:uncharacterized membrane protein (UPF0127 family)
LESSNLYTHRAAHARSFAFTAFVITLALIGAAITVYLFELYGGTNNTVVSHTVGSTSQRTISTEGTSSSSSSSSGQIAALAGFGVESIVITPPKGSNQQVVSGLVYVAETSSQQAQGFMNVASFGNCNGHSKNTSNSRCIGMMFVFSSPSEYLCFWMHDTPLPLQQVWITSNGTVVNIYQAQPESDASVCHSGQFVLETDPGEQISLGDSANQSAIT